MTINLSRKNSEVIDILNSIVKEAMNRIDNINKEIVGNFQLDPIKNAALYSLEMAKLTIAEAVKQELEKLNWVNVIVDCSEIDNDMKEIRDVINETGIKLEQDIKDLSEKAKILTDMDEITRKIHIKYPAIWGDKNLESFVKNFKMQISKKEIIAT